MRSLIITLFLLFAILPAFANDVDKIKTDKDVKAFLIKLDKRVQDDFFLILSTKSFRKKLNCSDLAIKWNVKTWEKVDFNADGRMDLLVTIYSKWSNDTFVFNTFGMVDKGNNSFNIVSLSNRDILRNCLLAKPIDIHKHKALRFYYTKRKKSKPQSFNYIIEPKIDTLIYKFNSFVEYNARPRYYAIKSIRLRMTGCFSECEAFELDIKSNGEAVYDAIAFNPVKGVFHGKLASNKLKEIKDLIAYLDVKKLEDNYAVSWTDDQKAILKITFEDGSTRFINDYGMNGTMGLKCLYNILFNLRDSKIWHK